MEACYSRYKVCLQCGTTVHIRGAVCACGVYYMPSERRGFCTLVLFINFCTSQDVVLPHFTIVKLRVKLIDRLGSESAKPIMVDLSIAGRPLQMELDTGAAFSIISESTRKAHFADVKLRPSSILPTRTNALTF